MLRIRPPPMFDDDRASPPSVQADRDPPLGNAAVLRDTETLTNHTWSTNARQLLAYLHIDNAGAADAGARHKHPRVGVGHLADDRRLPT